jgi:sugar/nucleoside kinase (ribokinase family)
MHEPCSAVVAGHICLDILPKLNRQPGGLAELMQPGRLTEVGAATLSTGGPVSNTGLVLKKLGIPTLLMGKVGDDLFGQAVRQIVAGYGTGLADGMIVDAAVPTSYTVVINLPGVDRIFLHCTGANDAFCAGDVRYDLVQQADLFHFGYPPLMRMMYEDSGRELVELFKRVKAGGAITSLDMALPDPASAAGRADWAAILQSTLPYVDIFTPSIEEILYMLRRPVYEGELGWSSNRGAGGKIPITAGSLREISGQLLAWGAKIVLLKLGEQGAYLRTAAGDGEQHDHGRGVVFPDGAWAGRELWAPCFQVQVAGTTGSGDATIAGFLSAYLRKMSPEEALTAAVAVGACNVEAVDALSGIRTWEETWERIDSGWPRHTLDLICDDRDTRSGGWQFDEQNALWMGSQSK